MHRFLFFILILFSSLFYLSPLFAQESYPVSLKVPPDFLSKICTPPLWKTSSVVWKGMKDKRIHKEIGVETLRNKSPSYIISTPDLESVLNETFKNLFAKCGMHFNERQSEESVELSAEIVEFYATVDRKLITGKGRAKSKIVFFVTRPSRKQTIQIGYELESKNTREKSLKQIEQILNELFLKTLEQIPLSGQFKEIE